MFCRGVNFFLAFSADQADPQGGDDVDLETASISSGGSARCSKRKLQPRRTVASSEDLDDIDKMKVRSSWLIFLKPPLPDLFYIF